MFTLFIFKWKIWKMISIFNKKEILFFNLIRKLREKESFLPSHCMWNLYKKVSHYDLFHFIWWILFFSFWWSIVVNIFLLYFFFALLLLLPKSPKNVIISINKIFVLFYLNFLLNLCTLERHKITFEYFDRFRPFIIFRFV